VKELVDLLFSVSAVASLHEVIRLLSPSTGRRFQLECPEGVGGFAEVLSDGEDLVDQIFNADDVAATELLFDEGVGHDRSAAPFDAKEAALVDQFANGTQAWIAPGDVRLDDAQHVQRGLVELDEDTIVDLPKPEKLQGLANTWMDLVDTSNTHDVGQLGFWWNVVVSVLSCNTTQPDLVPLSLPVLLHILFGPLEILNVLCAGFLALVQL